MLAPPPSDIPDLPAPDSAAQKTMLDNAIGIATRNDQRISNLTAMKAVSRYGHLVTVGNWPNLSDLAPFQSGDESIMYLTSKYKETVNIDQGIEKVSASGVDPSLMRISPTSEGGTRPALSQILRQANEGGHILWLRWETINGVKSAVFSFAVDKKKAIYRVGYCCFPTYKPVDGTNWRPFKKTVGIHGEFFIDPNSGATLRMVIKAEFAPADFVEREDTRIDYGTVTIDGNGYVVPLGSYTDTKVAVTGDSKKAYTSRHAMLVGSYVHYRLAGTAQN